MATTPVRVKRAGGSTLPVRIVEVYEGDIEDNDSEDDGSMLAPSPVWRRQRPPTGSPPTKVQPHPSTDPAIPEQLTLSPKNLSMILGRRVVVTNAGSGSTSSTGSTQDQPTTGVGKGGSFGASSSGEECLLPGNTPRSDDNNNNAVVRQQQMEMGITTTNMSNLLLAPCTGNKNHPQEEENRILNNDKTKKNQWPLLSEVEKQQQQQQHQQWNLEEGDDNNSNDENKYQHKNRHGAKHARQNLCVMMLSNFLFVVGAALYFWMSLEDLWWAQVAQDIPEHVLLADDDAVWNDYYRNYAAAQALEDEIMQERADKTGSGDTTGLMILGPPEYDFLQSQEPSDNNGYILQGPPGRLLIEMQQDVLQLSSWVSSSVAATAEQQRKIKRQQLSCVWYHSWWIDLPDDLKNAALYLGYEEDTWDDGFISSTQELPWNQLTPEEQKAAQLFGYTPIMWNKDADGTTTIDHNRRQAQEMWEFYWNEVQNNITTTTTNATSNTTTTTWYDYAWNELPEHVQSAASTLGYDENLWCNGGAVHTENLSWSELTLEQRDAAVVFGYSMDTWDGVDDGVNNNFTDTTEPPVNQWWDAFVRDHEDTTTAASTTNTTTSANITTINGTATNTTDNAWEEYAREFDNTTTDGWEQELYIEEYDNVTYDNASSARWENLLWSDLPNDIQYAALILGYNEYLWNNGLKVFTEDFSWDELTTQQQLAAGVFGYTQETWDGTSYMNATDVAESYNYNASDLETSSSPESDDNWGDSAWSELPENVQYAASLLGYDEHLWDTGGKASTEDLSWDELSLEQQQAAAAFGYTQETWDGVDETGANNNDNAQGTAATQDMDAPEIIIPNNNVDTSTWDNYYWSELPEHIQAAAMVLGYNQHSWDNGLSVFTEELSWGQLTQEQQQAASVFGYTQESWDEGSSSNNDTPPPIFTFGGQPNWRSYYWSALPEYVKNAAAVLGYNEFLWDTDGHVYTDDFFWSELTDAQREAATILGWTEETWNEEEFPYAIDDDYVFEVGSTGTWVSRYMILYFCAALCFVYVGMLDWFREQKPFHALMITAGLCGLVAAMLVERNPFVSSVFNLISIHFYFLESFMVIRNRCYKSQELVALYPPCVIYALCSADMFFFIGSVMDVVVSYMVFDVRAEWSLTVNRIGIAASSFWLSCALIYIFVSMRESGQRRPNHSKSAVR